MWIGVGVRDTEQSKKEQPVRGLAGPKGDASAESTVRARGRDDNGDNGGDHAGEFAGRRLARSEQQALCH